MSRLALINLIIATAMMAQDVSHTAFRVRKGASLPASCAVGDVFFKTAATVSTYQCLTTNNWTVIPTSSTTVGGSDTQCLYNNAGAIGGVTACTTDGNSLTLGSPTLTGIPVGPTQPQGDSSTKIATTSYVDTAVANAVAGVNPAIAVLAASTANVTGTYANGIAGVGATFTVTATGAFTLDGIAINTVGQRVLLKNQTSGFQNGMYTATVVGVVAVSPVFTRALDYNSPSDINNTGAIPVQSGTTNTTTSWLLTSSVTTIGTDALTYVQFTTAPGGIIGSPFVPQTSTGASTTATIPTSGWSIVNGALVNDFFTSYIGLSIPSNGTQNWRFYNRTNASSNYTIYAVIAARGANVGLDSQLYGVYLSDGTKYEGIGIFRTNSAGINNVEVRTLTSTTAGGTQLATASNAVASELLAVKIVDNGSTRVWSYWTAGAWVQLLSEASHTFLTETKAGFGGSSATSSSTYVECDLLYWNVQ